MEKVSIITPCYNDGAYLQESIDSVLNQTYKNIEIFIIDDGSDDPNTLAALAAVKNARIQLLHTKHVGPAAARNFGIEHCSGDYILPVDADDRIAPTYVEKCMNIIKNNESIGAVYCQAELFGEEQGRWDLPDYSLDAMLLDNIVFVTALFRKVDWERAGGFNIEHFAHGMEDYDFWLSILELGLEIVQIPEVLFFYRIKPVSRTTRFMDNINNAQEIYEKLYDNHMSLFNQYQVQYAKGLRRELIHQTFLNRILRKSLTTLEQLAKIPVVKQIVEKFILQRK